VSKLKKEKPVFNFFADLGEKIVSPWSLFKPPYLWATFLGR